MDPPVWLITASSSGFGKHTALEALKNGHRVIATARQTSKIEDLKSKGANTLALDVVQPLDQLQAIVKEAHAIYGRIDFLVNAAGYALVGAVEEASPEETYDIFNTNVFGLLNVTRAVLPYMHAQGSGVIVHFGSIRSWRGVAASGLYASTKWAVSGVTEALRDEVAPLGIHVCCVEPGYFRTGFLNPGARISTAVRLPAYEATAVGQTRRVFHERDNKQPGDIEKGCAVMFDVLTRKQGKEIPVRLVLGTDGYEVIRRKCEDTIELLEDWKTVTCSTDYKENSGNPITSL